MATMTHKTLIIKQNAGDLAVNKISYNYNDDGSSDSFEADITVYSNGTARRKMVTVKNLLTDAQISRLNLDY